jgi:hypothetical protein
MPPPRTITGKKIIQQTTQPTDRANFFNFIVDSPVPHDAGILAGDAFICVARPLIAAMILSNALLT